MNQIDLLDHGYLRLVDNMGDDSSIVRSARTSYDGANRAGDDVDADQRLTRYLLKNSHTTPFESCSATFEVKAPIFVYRQWHRHRTQSYNEMSARYTELPEEFYIPEIANMGTQSESSKQSRDIGEDITEEEAELRSIMQEAMRTQNREAFMMYRDLIRKKLPRELARSVLPLSTYSKMFATANLLNWFKFLVLRLHPHAQYEIRVYAEAILTILRELYPIATQAFEDFWLNQRTEKELIFEGAALGIGWMSADDYVDLDKGRDPRKKNMAEVLERAIVDLELK